MGKPTVAGTRITVEPILEKLAAGETLEQILSEHARLTPEGIRAAIAFAAEVLRADVISPPASVSFTRGSPPSPCRSQAGSGGACRGSN